MNDTKRFARVLMDNPEGTTADGQMFVVAAGLEWQPVEWLDPWDCDHQTAMCVDCVDAWACDNTVELPEGIEA